jgi:hypothetical protein
MRLLVVFFGLLTGILFVPSATSAASLFVDVGQDAYGPADTLVATVRLDNEGDCLNAVNVALGFPQDTLRAVDVGRGNSILSLWVEEPLLDNERGLITFAGGIPGGYCGRIQGDPALSNVLAKIVFTVIDGASDVAPITVLSQSRVYLHDGQGTALEVRPQHAEVRIQSVSNGKPNPWVDEVEADTVPPDPFTVEVQTTHGVFSGRYYLVFGTQDKQSGIDHYEYLEQGAWRPVVSPHELRGPFTLRDIQVKAVDKAGNERIAVSEQTELPRRSLTWADIVPLLEVMGALLIVGALLWMWRQRRERMLRV